MNYKPTKRDVPGRMVSTACGECERRLIPDLFDEFYFTALAVYNRFKLFGLPYRGGWAEQPAHLIDVIEGLESASRAVERERMDKWQQRKR